MKEKMGYLEPKMTTDQRLSHCPCKGGRELETERGGRKEEGSAGRQRKQSAGNGKQFSDMLAAARRASKVTCQKGLERAKTPSNSLPHTCKHTYFANSTSNSRCP